MNKPLTTKQFISSIDEFNINFNDLKHLLQSKHANLVQIFQAILYHPRYRIVAQEIVQNMVTNMYKMISEKLEVHIIENIWKSQFLQLFNIKNEQQQQKHKQQYQNKGQKIYSNRQNYDNRKSTIYTNIFMFLCQKMRSLKYKIRITALRSFQKLIHSLVHLHQPTNRSSKQQQQLSLGHLQKLFLTKHQSLQFDTLFTKSLKVMLKKQQLVKVVSYNQGLFLQLLQDEYHEIRVTTLAVLELISLHTPYFSVYDDRMETINALKQTILYMLNDQHELVRERALVAIYRITEVDNYYDMYGIQNNNMYGIQNNNNTHNNSHNIKVFSPLNEQQMFTILMCLKQNNSILRQKVYQCLKIIQIPTIHQLLHVIQKLYQTLLVYKLDKTKIYMLLKQFSISYKQMMLGFILQSPKENVRLFYEFRGDQQPSCKNFVYKGRLIVLRGVIKQLVKRNSYYYNNNVNNKEDSFREILPSYILRHLSYVEDTEIKLRLCQQQQQYGSQQQINSNKNININKQLVIDIEQQQKQPHYQSNQNDNNNTMQLLSQLQSILQYEMSLRNGDGQKSFDRELFNIIKQLLQVLVVQQQKILLDGNNLGDTYNMGDKIMEDNNDSDKKYFHKQQQQHNKQVYQKQNWFDVISSHQKDDCEDQSNNNSSNKQHIMQYEQPMTQVEMIKIQEKEILSLLRGNSNSSGGDMKERQMGQMKGRQMGQMKGRQMKGRQMRQMKQGVDIKNIVVINNINGNQQQSLPLVMKLNNLIFQIQTIRYIYSLNGNNNNQQHIQQLQHNNQQHIQQSQQLYTDNIFLYHKKKLINRIVNEIQSIIIQIKRKNHILKHNNQAEKSHYNTYCHHHHQYQHYCSKQLGYHKVILKLSHLINQYLQLLKQTNNNNNTHMNNSQQNHQLRRKQFKIRPITMGRVISSTSSLSSFAPSLSSFASSSITTTNYIGQKLLIIIQHPYKINSKEQFHFSNNHLWLKCTAANININNNNNNNGSTKPLCIRQTITFYIKFQQLFRLSQMRPIIDYNENKTIYTAQLPVKINSTKFNNLMSFIINNDNNNNNKLFNSANPSNEKYSLRDNKQVPKLTKRAEQVNAEKYLSYQQKEIIIKSVAIVFSKHQLMINNKQFKQQQNNNSINIDRQHQQCMYKVLTKWAASNSSSQ